jgi:hypothetical protein
MGFSLALVPIFFYPVVKDRFAVLGMGYIVYRGAGDNCEGVQMIRHGMIGFLLIQLQFCKRFLDYASTKSG